MNSLKCAVFLSLILSHSLRRRKCSTGPHAAQGQKQEMWEKKGANIRHKSAEMQENCDSRGKVSEGNDKLETSDRIRRADKCALSFLMFTLYQNKCICIFNITFISLLSSSRLDCKHKPQALQFTEFAAFIPVDI